MMSIQNVPVRRKETQVEAEEMELLKLKRQRWEFV